MNKQQEPSLRFKGFTGEWEEKVLGENASFTKGSGYSKSDLTDSGFPIILYGRLYTQYENIIENVDTFVSCDENALKSLGNEVIVPASGETAEDIARASAVYQQDVILGGDLNIITPNENIASPFLALTLTNGKSNQELAKKAQGKSVVHLRNDDLRACKVSFPSFPEQTHLGNFFRRLDSQIAESRAVLEKSRQLKKAMLAKMFPANGEKLPKIRFKGFEGEWECRKLGDLMNVTSVKRIHQSDWTNEGVRFLRARDIVAFNKGEKIEEPLFISKGKYNEYSEISGKVKIGDLLVTGVGTIGVPYLIEDEDPLYFKDGNVIWFQNENKIGGLFFYYSFLNNFIQDFIIETAGIGTVGTYTIDTGKKTPIFLPPTKSEQTAIGNFFRQLDETIALQAAEVEKLNQLKKGLLAAMLV